MRLLVLEESLEDLSQGMTYFEEQVPGLAAKYHQHVARTLQRIADFPYCGARLRKGFRVCPVKRFTSYGVI